MYERCGIVVIIDEDRVNGRANGKWLIQHSIPAPKITVALFSTS